MADETDIGGLPADTMAAIRKVFFEECEEHLTELEDGLGRLQRGESDSETIGAVFRAAHSIKGGAAIFDLRSIVRLAHLFESVLDVARADSASLTIERVKALLKATDGLADVVRAARDGREADEAQTQAVERSVAGLLSAPADPDPSELMEFQARPLDLGALGFGAGEAGASADFEIRFQPTARLYATANESLVLLRELSRLGAMQVTLDDRDVPTLDQLDPEASYLAWSIRLTTEAGEAAIRETFDFVEDDCELTVTRVAGPLADDAGAQEPGAPGPAAEAQSAPTPETSRTDPGSVAPTIRIDLDRVDRLVDLVSELVINQSMLVQQISTEALQARSGVPATLDDLAQLTREIQDSVMAIRAQPVRAVFQRMGRLVREAEAATGKPVRLVTEGEDTEVDRTVIERLNDPLTHMIRNAVDHGLESPERRAMAGKPAEGVVRLSAAHRGGRIIIEVSDDGGGIDHERVRATAIARGIVAADAVLTDAELDNLIFAPGFSTAERISDLSGRGVGMDVVRSSIQALGGRIGVTSRPGQGSTFTLSLPLTLAVLDGMLVSVRGQSAVVPLTTLVESFGVGPEDVRRLGAGGQLLNLRGSHVPLIDLGEVLGYPPVVTEDERAVALLVEDEQGQRAALLVDAIRDQRQVVIKSLDVNYREIFGAAAATILGDGRVALILDVNAILSAERRAGLAARHPQAA